MEKLDPDAQFNHKLNTPMPYTPRTDEAEFEVFDGQNVAAVVESEFARKLERELAAKDKTIAILKKTINHYENQSEKEI